MGGRLSIVAKHEKRTGDGTGVGLFFPLPEVLAEGFPSLGDNDRSPPHVTFLYVGNVAPEQEDVFLSTCRQVFAEWGRPTRAQHRGLDYFENPAKPGRVAINRVRFDDDMADLRSKLSSRLQDVGIEIQDSFPVYQPHTTLAYLDGLDGTYDGLVPGGQWEVTEAVVWGFPKVHEIPLGESRVEKRASSNLVYRIQPKGKPLQGWRSKDMDGNPINGTFVFESMKDLTETVSLWRPEELEDIEILEIRYDGPRDEHPLESGTLIDADQATIVRRLPLKQGLRRAAEKIPGGLAKGKKPSDFDQKALAKGIKVEREHTEDESVAREIAMDHLTEDPDYYDKLGKIEKQAVKPQWNYKGPADADAQWARIQDSVKAFEAEHQWIQKQAKLPFYDLDVEAFRQRLKKWGGPGNALHATEEGSPLGTWIVYNFKVIGTLGDHQLAGEVTFARMRIRAIWGSLASVLDESPSPHAGSTTNSKLHYHLERMAQALSQYAEVIQACLDQVAPGKITYSGFRVANPGHLTESAVRRLLDGVDYVIALFKKRGVLPLLTETVKTVVFRMPASGEEGAAGFYESSRRQLHIIANSLSAGGRLLTVFVHEVFLHEMGHHVEYMLSGSAEAEWKSAWEPIAQAQKGSEQRAKEVFGVTAAQRKRFWDILTASKGNLSAIKLKPVDKVKFHLWLSRPPMGGALVTPKNLRWKGPGVLLQELLADPTEAVLKDNGRGLEPEDVARYVQQRMARWEEELGVGWGDVLPSPSFQEIEAYRETDPVVAKAIDELLVPTDYGRTNEKEDFAETFVWFMAAPERLSETALYRMQRALSLSGLYGKPVMRLAEAYDKLEKIEKTAMEFPTEDAMETYLKEHPGADKSLHHVKKHEEPEQVPAKKSWHTKLKDGWQGLQKALGQEWQETKVLGKTVIRLLKGDDVSEQEIAAAKEQAVDVLKLITTQGFPFPGASVYIEFIIRALNKALGKNWTSLPSAFRPKLASSVEWLHFAKTFTLNEGDPILFGKWKNKPGVISGFKMDPVSGDPIVVITPAKGRGDKEVKLLKIRYDKARAQEMPDPAMRVASRYVQRRHLQAAIGDVEKYLPDFQAAADNYRTLGDHVSGLTPEEWEFFRKSGPTEAAKYRDIVVGLTRRWVTLIQAGQPYVRALLEAKEIPKGKTKAVELAARAFLAVSRNPKKIFEWWPKNVRHVDLLLTAHTWPDKQEGGDQLFTVGPFKVHNSTNLRGAELEATKKTLEDAIKRIQTTQVPEGLSKVLYGDVYLAAKLRQAKVMAWYYITEDHLYLRPAKSKTMALSHQLIHELTHRYWLKFASPEDKKSWGRHHLDMSMPTRDQVKLPVPGDILPFKVQGWSAPPKVRRVFSGGYELEPSGGADAMSIYMKIHELIPYLAKTQNFPTAYASKNAEEHFCEATAMYLLGTLPEKLKAPFEAAWGRGAPKVASRYLQMRLS